MWKFAFKKKLYVGFETFQIEVSVFLNSIFQKLYQVLSCEQQWLQIWLAGSETEWTGLNAVFLLLYSFMVFDFSSL